jgi:putative two-component system response regulator
MLEEFIKTAKFLIVDDDLSTVRLLECSLERWGCFNVESTTDSKQALPLFQRAQPDILLLGLPMPPPDGFAVMEQIHALLAPGTYLPILVLTADAAQVTKRKSLAAGAKDF